MECEIKESLSSIIIDKDFLTSALGNNVEIVSFQVSQGSKPGDNYTSVLYAIDVEVKNKEAGSSVETRNLLLKSFPSHPARQESTIKSNFFYTELQVYQTWLPELHRFQTEFLGIQKPYKLPFTHVVAGKAVDFSGFNSSQIKQTKINHLDNFILMEDLRKSRGFLMPKRKEPLNIHHLRLIVPALAQTHALGWAYKNKVTPDIPGKFPFLRMSNMEEAYKEWFDVVDNNFDEELKAIEKHFGTESEITRGARNFKPHISPLLDFLCGKDVEELCHKVMRVKNCKELQKPWKSIIHGDCWSNNILFRCDSTTGLPVEATLIDLQLVTEGCVTIDLLMVLYCGTTPEFRRNHLEELLQLYTQTFTEVCTSCDCPTPQGFNFESFKDRFHRGKVLGFLCGLMMFPLTLQDDDATVDLEAVDESQDFAEMLQNSVGGSGIMNPLVTERILQLAQEMYDEGII